jgi:cellobiose-specific phosphotransferase system component IIC
MHFLYSPELANFYYIGGSGLGLVLLIIIVVLLLR